MNRISLSVMLLVGIAASKEPFFVEAYKLRGDSACLFHRYGKRGSGPDELMEANSVSVSYTHLDVYKRQI